MFDAAQLLNFRSSNSILWKAVYAERKLSRHYLKDVSITALVERLSRERISIKVTGTVVLGLAKIFVRKIRFLLEDCNEAVLFICSRQPERSKEFRQLPSRGITLDLELSSKFIGDEMIEEDDEVIRPEVAREEDVEIFGGSDFNDMSYVEQAGDSTVGAMRLSTEVTQIGVGEPRGKRRRTVMDSELEYDSQTFRQNLRNTNDIVSRRDDIDITTELLSKISIAPEILAGLRMFVPRPRESIEEVRNAALAEQYLEPEFTDDVITTVIDEEEPVSEDLFNAKDLPESFCFDSVVSGYTRHEKSVAFLSLLNKLGQGRMKARQDVPFGRIHCVNSAA
jgi:hypothetical protein